MAEYISREAAKRAIMSQYLNRANKTKYADVIDALPAADVVPVVRCCKCKYSAVDFENRRYCKLVTYYNHVPDDWFCADGEQKDGDGE